MGQRGRLVALGCVLCAAGCAAAPEPLTSMGPLDTYLDRAHLAEWDARDAAAEEQDLAAACMKALGFEYTPWVETGPIAVPDVDAMPPTGTLEYAQQYGYGASTYFDMPGTTTSPQGAVDPNEAYVGAMSESEQQAYAEALWGPPTAAGTPTEGGGCMGDARREVDARGGDPRADPTWKQLLPEVSAMWNRINADPRVAELDAAWSDCMAEAGHDYATPDEASGALSAEWEALQSANMDAGVVRVPQADKRAQQEREIAVAVADQTCRDETGYDDSRTRIQYEYEQEFVTAHHDELESWAAQYGDGPSQD